MLGQYDRLINVLRIFALCISVSSLVVIVLLNSVNLVLRWSLDRPIEWVLEVSLILFVYSVMFILPVIYRDKQFIQMHLIEEIISKGAAKYLNLVVEVIILTFLVYLLLISIKLSAGQISMLSRGLGIPRIYITLPVPIGASLAFLVGISNIAHQIYGMRSES